MWVEKRLAYTCCARLLFTVETDTDRVRYRGGKGMWDKEKGRATMRERENTEKSVKSTRQRKKHGI